ncbi:DUF488 domain-containing protein [Vibrio alfacsensis]|uniref:DUF488 domain-containing protein n=1 Tax=Vibrio alfacsensis TaxID=1074311 RepID=UPI004067B923
MKIYTIGFTKKNAERFFSLLKSNGVETLIDVRLNNVSQLAGFAKKDDLKYFLKELCSINYIHMPVLSPTKEILEGYKKKNLDWREYESLFNQLLMERGAHRLFEAVELDGICFLCSEHEAVQCHRRLVAEFIAKNVDVEIEIEHLQ